MQTTDSSEPRRSWIRWPRSAPLILTVLAVVVLVGVLLEAIRQIGQFIWPIFVPLLISVALAYILEPVVTWFERAGMPRRRAILVTLLAAAAAVVLLIVFIVPRLAAQFSESAQKLPLLVQSLLEGVQPALGSLRSINEGIYRSVNDRITEYSENPGELTTPLLEGVQSGIGGVFGLTTSLFEAVLIPFFIYYILRDVPKLRATLELLTPPRYRTTTHEVFDRIAAVISNFIRGQLTVCAAMAILDSAGFVALGVPMPIFLGVISGFGHLVPYIGPVFAAVLTLSLTALDSPEWWRLGGVVGVYVVVQVIESVYLTPTILGTRLELHPFWVLTGIAIAGHVFGILGMILAAPVIAIARVVLTYCQHAYLHSSFYQGPLTIAPLPANAESPPPRDAFAETSQMAGDEEVSPVTGDPA